MKAVTVRELRKALNDHPRDELIEMCLQLSKYKKENKELLTYVLFESSYEDGYIESIKEEINEQFDAINTRTFYYIKKSVRKILRTVKKFIRYSKNKETEITLLIYFCEKLLEVKPSIKRNTMLVNLYIRERSSIEKKIEKLHEDLQLDFRNLLQDLTEKEPNF
jgi:phosphoglycerate-specific signal transduction histidine kinase